MPKLLHLADVQLGGCLFAGTDALLRRMRAAARTAFRRAISCALKEDVDAVLIAGNLFDERRLDYDTEQFLQVQLARLDEAGVPCFYATGPRDRGDERAREGPFAGPSSLHHFTAATPEEAVLKDANGQPMARIVGAGAGSESDRPARSFPRPEGALPYVGLLHAGPDEEGKEPALPDARGYAYWALGGAAQHRCVSGEAMNGGEDGKRWYAGPAVPHGPHEAGPQGVLLVTLQEDEAPQVAFRPLAPLCWADLTLDTLEDVDTQHTLLRRAERAFAAATRDDGGPAAYAARFTLVGGCPLASSLHETLHDADQRSELEAALAEQLDLEAAFLRARHLTLPAAPSHHRDEPHVLREALGVLDRAATDSALLRTLAPGALADAPSSASTGTEGLDYLRDTLGGLDREACARLLVPESSDS